MSVTTEISGIVNQTNSVKKNIFECILLEDPRLTEYQGAECTLYVVQSKCNSVSTVRLRTANGTMKIKRGIRLWEAKV